MKKTISERIRTKKDLYKKENFLRIENKIYSDFISIPNCVVNSNISIQAKYLYGIICNEHYYGGFTKSIIDISNILSCCISTSRKCIDELVNHNYVFIYYNGNVRHIVPNIPNAMIIDHKNTIRCEQHDRDFEILIEKNKKRNVSDDKRKFLIEFASQIV